MEPLVFCFGEILLRMSPVLGGQWLADAQMPVYVGGAEANVASALARWGLPVVYGTAMPDHYLSREIENYLQGLGVRPSVVWTGARLGTYYLPQGSDLQHAGVIYDRAYSSFAGLEPGMIDWDTVLKGITWFHFSAISPALTAPVAEVCREALEVATRLGITISVDLNYRAKLWQYGASPTEVMPDLVSNCDVVMGNLWAAESLLGIPVDPFVHASASYLEHARITSEEIMRRFPRCRYVANTFRFELEGLKYFASLAGKDSMSVSREYFTPTVVDKVGSGDCFMGGLIFGLCQGWTPGNVIEFAAAAAFGKLQELGDSTRQTVAQIMNRYAQ
jgi:2-dehydro-3-deoxygluconokinase